MLVVPRYVNDLGLVTSGLPKLPKVCSDNPCLFSKSHPSLRVLAEIGDIVTISNVPDEYDQIEIVGLDEVIHEVEHRHIVVRYVDVSEYNCFSPTPFGVFSHDSPPNSYLPAAPGGPPPGPIGVGGR
jgi:hypothetical protein